MIIESIKKQNTDNGVRLTAQITSDRQSFEIWYEASSEIGYYFCDERADAFVVALMPYAMSIGEDIISNVPISAQLKHSLVKSQIPYMVKLSQKYHNISIISEINSDKLESANHVGTSISCGVDSLSTLVWEGLLADESRYKIDSLTLFNAGHYGNNQEISEKKFSVHFQNATDFCNEHGYQLIRVDSNVGSVLPNEFVSSVSFLILSVVLSLQKYFSVYYFASTYCLFQSEPIFEDSESYDFITTQNVGTENIRIISACGEKTRIEKVKLLTEHPSIFKHVFPCVNGNPPHNCGYCEKCRYTIMALDLLGRMDLAETIFDLSYYKKNRTSLYAFMLLHQSRRIDIVNAPIYRELRQYMKENRIRLPFGTVLFLPYQYYRATMRLPIRHFIRRLLQSVLGEKAVGKLKHKREDA